MDKIIKSSKFLHDNEDERERFEDAINQWSSSNIENCTPEDSKKALLALGDKLTEKKYPDFENEGWRQARYAFDQCHQIAVSIIEQRKAQPSSFHTVHYDFILRLMEHGPGTIHFYVILECLKDSDVELRAYIKTLQGEKLTRLITALTKDVKINETVEAEVFYDKFERYISDFISDDTFLDAQLKQHMKPLMNSFVHLTLDFFHLDEDSCKEVVEAGDEIFRRFEKPWESFNDTESLKSYIKKCTDLFKVPKFPQHDAAKKATRTFLNDMSDGLGKQGLVAELSVPIMDLVVSMAKCSCDDEDFLTRCMRDTLDFFHRLPDKAVKKKPAVFQAMSKRYATAIGEVGLKYLEKIRFATIIMDVLVKTYANDAKLSKEFVQLMIPLFQHACEDTMRACSDIASEKKSIKWQEYPEIAKEVAKAISSFKIPDVDDDDNEEVEKAKKFVDNLKSVTEHFFEGLKKAKLMSEYGGHMLQLALTVIEMKKEYAYGLAEEMGEKIEIDIKKDKDNVIKAMKRILAIVKNEDYPWDDEWSFERALEKVTGCCTECIKDPKVLTDEDLKLYTSVCYECQQHDPLNPETGDLGSAHYNIFLTVMNELVQWLCNLNKCDIGAELIPGIINTFEVDNEHICSVNVRFLVEMGACTSGQKLLAPSLDDLIKTYLNVENADLIRAVDQLYPFNPKPMAQHYRVLMDTLLDTGEQDTAIWLCQLFHKVSKKQPDLFTEKDAQKLLARAKDDQNNQPTLLMMLQELAKRRPEIMVKNIDALGDETGLMPMLTTITNDMICSVALYKQDVAPKAINYLIKSAKVHQDYANLYTSLNSIRQIGFKYPEIIKPKRAEIENLEISDPNGLELKRTIIDMIDGKTPENLRKELEEQQKGITDLVGRVEDAEEAIVEVTDKVDQQGKQLDTVKKDVGEQGQRLNKVEVTVDETVLKVEEIDSKTLSHAPYWSRDVSKLLNPKSENDWILLASRLGYTNDDIRGWAQQADPCMAMLNEWYATRKTSEATHAILNQLQEMNRMDAAIIVENAMKNAEAVVEDEDFVYASPPPIFISYQWGHQPEVKLLQKHLEMAGYDCWLDVGQMGGGDKLFEKIDKGIRAAKVIISCVTDKYSKSPNCNREVNLSVNLNKPIIPLLLEKCTWPPPGSMGPIFSEYLFIRFFQRGGEELPDQRYWPEGKFLELLLQLNMFGLPPDEDKVEPVYRDWWMPVVEEIKIDKSKTKNGGQISKVEEAKIDEKAAVSPDVFISYQWGKQKNIIKLYERLTSLGLTCWLDIKQMGGGDSLYDKIDRGIRGCKVMLSCVTTKYALSANCRREFSLADALQKPLIPLLLEKMTWPPTGPMGVVLSQLLYIDFAKDETVQMSWEGAKFDELLSKINRYVPVSLTSSSQGKDSNKEGTQKEQDKGKEKQNEDNRLQTEEKQRIENSRRDTKLEEEKKQLEKQQKNEQIRREEARLKELENQRKQEKEARQSVKAEETKSDRKKDSIQSKGENRSTKEPVRKTPPAVAASSSISTRHENQKRESSQRDPKLEEKEKELEKQQKDEQIRQEEERLKELENQKNQEKEAKRRAKEEKPRLEERKTDIIQNKGENVSTNDDDEPVRKAAPAGAASASKPIKATPHSNKTKAKSQESGPKPPPSQQAKNAKNQWRPSPTPSQATRSSQPPRSQQSSASSGKSIKPLPSQQAKTPPNSVPSQAFKSAQRPRPAPPSSPTKPQQKNSQPSSKAQQEPKSLSSQDKQETSAPPKSQPTPKQEQQPPPAKEKEAPTPQPSATKKSSTCSVI